jgi:EAL domain-containing protein (putative c-di-GMP-specific phosphodiesterase class I)/ActR/RegA family two-component response regulator
VTSFGASPLPGLGAPPEPIRVMIADDEVALRIALAELLDHEDGMSLVGSAADATEAIRLADELRPRVALVDVKMPGGGPWATREIMRASPQTRVIALSAYEDRPSVLEMLRSGASGYLVKGGEADEIVDSIARVASGGTHLSREVVGGIVDELASQSRADAGERERREAARGEIERFAAGNGLTMVYQPIVNLRTRDVVGLEALARFASVPARTPERWFSEAVALELGVVLELAAIRRALTAVPNLPESAYLSVNASHMAAMSEQLPPMLAQHATRLVVEITEHERVEDYAQLSAALARLRRLGARVAIDDAGAGYSSLRHTLHLAPDIVKLDISLTRGIDADRAKRALAASLISFADEMGMEIVAEGIETLGELSTLLELGVPFGQGYFLAEPAPIA